MLCAGQAWQMMHWLGNLHKEDDSDACMNEWREESCKRSIDRLHVSCNKADYTAGLSCHTLSWPIFMPESFAPSVVAVVDPIAAGRWQQQRPSSSPWLHEEVAQRMLQRLDIIKLQPANWAHWQAEQGGLQAHEALRQRYPQARAWHMPGQELPPQSSMGLFWANMVLDKAPDPRAMLTQWQQVLAPEGFVMFSVPGPGSLQQLRALYQEKGWAPPCQAFADLHDWGDLVQQAGFADVVMDTELITLTFASPQRLLQELRELGRNLSPARSRATRARGWLHAWYEAVQTLVQPDGQLHLTFEIIYGHAVRGAQSHNDAGEATIDLAHMRRMLLGRC